SLSVLLAGATLFAAAKALKWWAIATLGPAWTFRVIVVPGAPLVASGPYRFVAHPNYIGVVGELVGATLMTGAFISGPIATALIEGRYAEVDTLTEKLDTRDPNVVALRARAAIARGRYADAEASLRPVVSRFPTSEAALQLGLLMQMLGREFAPILDRVAMLSDTSSDPNEVARAGRALRALGRF